jgi:hypothetical protein
MCDVSVVEKGRKYTEPLEKIASASASASLGLGLRSHS